MSSYLKPQSPLYHKAKNAYFYPLTTVDQVVLENGNRLNGELSKHLFVDINNVNGAEPNGINADTLGGISADEYVKLSDLENANSGMTMELLWENASPSSSMNAQTINLDLKNYILFLIYFKSEVSGTSIHNIILGKNETINVTVSKEYCYQRRFEISNNYITLGSGEYYGTYGNGTKTVNEEIVVPIYIYGIKGVSA